MGKSEIHGIIPPPLHIIDNFLTVQELDEVVDALLNKNTWVITPTNKPGDMRQHYTLLNSNDESLLRIDPIIKDKIRKEIEYRYGEPFLTPINLSFNRWMIGDSQGAHSDSGHSDGELIIEKRGHEPPPVGISEHLNDVGVVLYLTDGFEGGEIFFERQNCCVRPAAGTLITFPANHFYVHGVKTLTAGERLTMTSFWVSAKSVALTLAPSIYDDWWKRVYNPEDVVKLLPKEMISHIEQQRLPPPLP